METQINHYKWLRENFELFLNNLGYGNLWEWNGGIIGAHGDKGYGYRQLWENAGISFHHGMAIYLLSYLNPWAKTVRETEGGWVAPDQWVISTYKELKQYLPN